MLPGIENNQSTVSIAAHRGASRRFPENSVAAIKEAINIAMEGPDVGFIIEMDLRTTCDGQLVILHDSFTDRITTSSGPIKAKTLAELQALEMKPMSEIVPASEHNPDRAAHPFYPVTKADLRIAGFEEAMELVSKANEERSKYGLPISMVLQLKYEPRLTATHYIVDAVRSGLSELLDYIGFTTSANIVAPPSETSKQLAHVLNHTEVKLPPIVMYSAEGFAGKRDLEEVWEHLHDDVKKHIDPNNQKVASPPFLRDEFAEMMRSKLNIFRKTKRLQSIGFPPDAVIAVYRDEPWPIAEAVRNGGNVIIGNYPGRAMEAVKAHKVDQAVEIAHQQPQRSISFLDNELERRQSSQHAQALEMQETSAQHLR